MSLPNIQRGHVIESWREKVLSQLNTNLSYRENAKNYRNIHVKRMWERFLTTCVENNLKFFRQNILKLGGSLQNILGSVLAIVSVVFQCSCLSRWASQFCPRWVCQVPRIEDTIRYEVISNNVSNLAFSLHVIKTIQAHVAKSWRDYETCVWLAGVNGVAGVCHKSVFHSLRVACFGIKRRKQIQIFPWFSHPRAARGVDPSNHKKKKTRTFPLITLVLPDVRFPARYVGLSRVLW